MDAGVVDRTRDFGWLADRQLLLLRDARARRGAASGFSAGRHGARRSPRRRELLAVPSPMSPRWSGRIPLGLFDLLRERSAAAQPGLNLGVERRRLRHAPTAGAGSSSRGRGGRRTTRTFSRALDARLTRIAAIAAPPAARAREPATTSRAPPLRGRVRRRPSHRRRDRSGRPAREHPEHGRLARADPAAALPRVPQPVAGGGRLAAVGAVARGRARRARLRRRDAVGGRDRRRRPCCSASASTASCCCMSRIGSRSPTARPTTRRRRSTGPASSMLLGMWTTAATFYGLTFVDFPSLQQLGLLIGHSMVVCGVLTLVLVPALLPRRAPRRARARAASCRGWRLDRAPAPRDPRGAAPSLTVVLGRRRDSAARQPDARSPALDDRRGARSKSEIGPAFGLPGDVYVVLAEGPTSSRCSRPTSGSRRVSPASCPDLAFAAADAAAAVGTRRRRRRCGADRDARACRSTRSARRSSARARRPASRQARSSRSRRGCRALLDPAQRLTYEGYVAHGLGDLIGRFVVRDGGRWLLATYVFPADRGAGRARPGDRRRGGPVADADRPAARQPRAGAAASCRSSSRGSASARRSSSLLVVGAFRDWRLSLLRAAADGDRPDLGRRPAGARRRRARSLRVFAVVTFVGIGVDYGVHLVHRYHERGERRARRPSSRRSSSWPPRSRCSATAR